MAKAVVVTKSGATVTLEGSKEEVGHLLARLEGDSGGGAIEEKKPVRAVGSKVTPSELIAELRSDGFFREPRELGAVRSALQEMGHFYPVTTLSPVLLRLVRKKELRRLKEQKRWMYVG